MPNRDGTGWITPASMAAGYLIAFAGAFSLDGFLGPLLQGYLQLFGQTRHDQALHHLLVYHDIGTLLPLLPFSAVGIVLLFMSSWIDRDALDGAEGVPMFIGGQIFLTVFGLVLIWLYNWATGVMEAQSSFFGYIFAFVIAFLVAIPAGIAMFVIFPIMLAPFIAGLFCIPRIAIYYTTQHPLLTAWNTSKDGVGLSPSDIAGALGNPARNPTEALKLRHDLERLEQEIQKHQKELAAEREELRSVILGDAERFETEKRMSKILAELDTLNTEVDVYRKYLQEKGGRQ